MTSDCEAVMFWVSLFFKFTAASLCTLFNCWLRLGLLKRQQSGWSFEAVTNPFLLGSSVHDWIVWCCTEVCISIGVYVCSQLLSYIKFSGFFWGFFGGGGSFAFAVYLLYLIHVIHNSVNAQQRKQIGLQKLVCTADSVTLYAGVFFRHWNCRQETEYVFSTMFV